MSMTHQPDWKIVSCAGARHEIWQNRYGHLAMKTAAGTWKLISLADVHEEIMFSARIRAALMVLGITKKNAAEMVGCTQCQMVTWAGGMTYPRKQNETKIESIIIEPAIRAELSQSRSLTQGLEVMDD